MKQAAQAAARAARPRDQQCYAAALAYRSRWQSIPGWPACKLHLPLRQLYKLLCGNRQVQKMSVTDAGDVGSRERLQVTNEGHAHERTNAHNQGGHAHTNAHTCTETGAEPAQARTVALSHGCSPTQPANAASLQAEAAVGGKCWCCWMSVNAVRTWLRGGLAHVAASWCAWAPWGVGRSRQSCGRRRVAAIAWQPCGAWMAFIDAYARPRPEPSAHEPRETRRSRTRSDCSTCVGRVLGGGWPHIRRSVLRCVHINETARLKGVSPQNSLRIFENVRIQ